MAWHGHTTKICMYCLLLLGLQSHLVTKPFKLSVVCPLKRDCAPKRVERSSGLTLVRLQSRFRAECLKIRAVRPQNEIAVCPKGLKRGQTRPTHDAYSCRDSTHLRFSETPCHCGGASSICLNELAINLCSTAVPCCGQAT